MASTKLFKQLGRLTGWRQKVFLLALAERSLPHLFLYGDLHGMRRQAERIRRMLDLLWQAVGQRVPQVWMQRSLDASGLPVGAVEVVNEWREVLDSDESFGAQAALHSLHLVEGVLLSFRTQSVQQAAALGQISFDFVTRFVEMQAGEGLDDEALVDLFESSNWCRQELQWQRRLCAAIEGHQGAPESDWLAGLRTEAANDGVSGIGISAEPEEDTGD